MKTTLHFTIDQIGRTNIDLPIREVHIMALNVRVEAHCLETCERIRQALKKRL